MRLLLVLSITTGLMMPVPSPLAPASVKAPGKPEPGCAGFRAKIIRPARYERVLRCTVNRWRRAKGLPKLGRGSPADQRWVEKQNKKQDHCDCYPSDRDQPPGFPHAFGTWFAYQTNQLGQHFRGPTVQSVVYGSSRDEDRSGSLVYGMPLMNTGFLQDIMIDARIEKKTGTLTLTVVFTD